MGGVFERTPSIEILVWEEKTFGIVSFPPQAGWGKLFRLLTVYLTCRYSSSLYLRAKNL